MQAPKPINAVHYKYFFEPLPEWTGVPYSIDQHMSGKIVHWRWAGASGEEPMWVSEGLWIRVNDGLISYCEDVDFEVVPRAIGLRMACESSEYGGYPIGDWAGLSYNILVSIQLKQFGILTQISSPFPDRGPVSSSLRLYSSIPCGRASKPHVSKAAGPSQTSASSRLGPSRSMG